MNLPDPFQMNFPISQSWKPCLISMFRKCNSHKSIKINHNHPKKICQREFHLRNFACNIRFIARTSNPVFVSLQRRAEVEIVNLSFFPLLSGCLLIISWSAPYPKNLDNWWISGPCIDYFPFVSIFSSNWVNKSQLAHFQIIQSDLSENYFTGSIPTEIGQLRSLIQLSVSFAKFEELCFSWNSSFFF